MHTFSKVTLLLLLLFTGTQAQTGVTVNGTILDQNNAVLVNAEVRVLSIASGLILRTTTDSSGRYELTGLQRGSHQILVSSNGFATAARSITWRRNGGYT